MKAAATVEILNERGLHARASAKFVTLASGQTAAVEVEKDGSKVAGTSIMGLMMLGAAKGDHVTISAEGEGAAETLAVHPGTQSGHLMRLRGRGVPHVRGRGRGDLVVQVVVDTPTNLTKAQQELLRQFAAESGEDVGPPDEGLMSRLRSAFGRSRGHLPTLYHFLEHAAIGAIVVHDQDLDVAQNLRRSNACDGD